MSKPSLPVFIFTNTGSCGKRAFDIGQAQVRQILSGPPGASSRPPSTSHPEAALTLEDLAEAKNRLAAREAGADRVVAVAAP